MKSTFAALILMSGLTVLLTTVRTTRLHRRWRLLLAAMVAFIGAQVLLVLAIARAGMTAPSDLARVFATAAATPADERPELVILGSSYSSRGLDGPLLERLLAERGVHVRVLQLTWPGAYAYEQDFLLSRELRAFRLPAAILVEIGSEASVTEKPENRCKPQVIGYRDAERSLWMLRQVWYGGHDWDVRTRFEHSLEIVLHSLAYYTQLGFLRSAAIGTPAPFAGFQPEESSPSPPSAEALREALAQTLPPVANPAATAFRRYQLANWSRRGIGTILFFQPPMASAARRGMVAGICRSLGANCLPAAPGLLSDLSGDYWTDLGHLNRAGAKIWTRALADQLASGWLHDALQ